MNRERRAPGRNCPVVSSPVAIRSPELDLPFDPETEAGQHGVVRRVKGVPIEAVQGIPYVNLINRELAGAKGISLTLVTVPPGGGCVPHFHEGSETALYLLSGEVLTRYGTNLEQEILTRAGEALYIAPGVPHSARNIGAVPAIAVSARTDADEQERTIPYIMEALQ